MEELNYTSSLGKETLGSKAAGLSWECQDKKTDPFSPSSLSGANRRGKEAAAVRMPGLG